MIYVLIVRVKKVNGSSFALVLKSSLFNLRRTS